MPRRRADDDDDESWADIHLGEAAMGSITELRTADPKGKPYERKVVMGFCIDPLAYRPRRRRKKSGS
jgi:hypothetical protein